MQASKRLNDLIWTVAAGVAVWYVTQRLMNGVAEKVTRPAGQAMSDLFASLNGWEPVELTPLQIRDFYLTDDFRLTQEAEGVLWRVGDYQAPLYELFGSRGGQLKPQYRALINVPITKENLQ
ncbi:hypothetical protein [Photobacterium sp. 53610]|uniref:hypothetical protein n=1 Tax=Photobacterium sp. 53610 TaxID=3102789 RepID=UPI002ED78E05